MFYSLERYPMLVVGCSRHHLNSLSESFSSWLMKSSCQGEATGFPALPSGSSHVTGVGDDVIFPFRSRGGGWGGMDSLSARGLSALIKRSVFRRISWFLPRGQDFSGSECAGCCAGRREVPPPVQLKAALETLIGGGGGARRKPQDNAGNKYFPASIISFYIFSPHPLPLLSFWFLVHFLASFVVTSVRLLFPWRRLISLPAQIALKHPIQQKKESPAFWPGWQREGREEDAGGLAGRSLLGPHS